MWRGTAALAVVLATPSQAGPPSGFPGANMTRTVEPGGSISASLDSGGELWFWFVAESRRTFVVSTLPETLADSSLTLWSGDGLLDSDDDGGFLLAASCSFAAPAGTVYGRVTAYGASSGAFVVTVDDVTGGVDSAVTRSCSREFYQSIELCPRSPTGGAIPTLASVNFSCVAGCAAALVPFYADASVACKSVLHSMAAFSHFATKLLRCDATAYGSPELAIAAPFGQPETGHIQVVGFREWFTFVPRTNLTYHLCGEFIVGSAPELTELAELTIPVVTVPRSRYSILLECPAIAGQCVRDTVSDPRTPWEIPAALEWQRLREQ
jgi:hypothetical protein